MKIVHYLFLVIVSLIVVTGILFSLFFASFCFNPEFFNLVESDNFEVSSYNVWLISCFILAFTFVEGLVPVFKKLILWLYNRFRKLESNDK